MITVSLNEAKTHLSSLISGVEHRGEKVMILKHGVAVAEIIPVTNKKRTSLHSDIKNIDIRFDPLKPTEGEWSDV
jgi:antitoxin (DNA-binding transcriptional repressor) of toxin-antitoxin stability system